MSDSAPDAAPLPLVEHKSSADSRWKAVFGSRMWILTVVCGLVATTLVITSVTRDEHVITVRFNNGHGIKLGDALRFRGIVIGEVTDIHLDSELERLELTIRIESNARRLAREGSQFWIVRPEISLSRVRGLDTIVGARYINVRPGTAESPAQSVFDGLESPPTLSGTADTEILIRFQDGRGLQVGDVVKYRGIEVGEATSVTLSPDMQTVDVRVRLTDDAVTLARQGSQFWIERPTIAMSGVRGLDTVVGGRYIAVLPGLGVGDLLQVFDGLEQPPTTQQGSGGSLEFILESRRRYGLTRGAPLKFRGIEVGQISSLGLSSDATRVEARVVVESEYRQLIRTNTRFWAISGLDLEIGFSGVQMDVDSLSSLAAGGIALSTAEPSGAAIKNGHRFTLLNAAPDEPLEAQAKIPLGSSLLPDNRSLPRPLTSVIRVTKKGWLGSTREDEGWGVILEGDKLLILSDISIPDTKNSDDRSTTLVIEGQELKAVLDANLSHDIKLFNIAALDRSSTAAWPLARLRNAIRPEDCLIVADPLSSPMPIDAARLTPLRGQWRIDSSFSLGPQWQGAFVVSRSDGALVGLVRCDKANDSVLLLSKGDVVAAGRRVAYRDGRWISGDVARAVELGARPPSTAIWKTLNR